MWVLIDQILEEKKKGLLGNIRDGIVLDDLEPGSALSILNVLYGSLDLPTGYTVTFAMNIEDGGTLPQKKKDVMKIHGDSIYAYPLEKVHMLSLLAPRGILYVIKNFSVIEKVPLSSELPSEFVDLVKCINPDCISHEEREVERGSIRYRHEMVNRGGGDYILVCHYCRWKMKKDDVPKHLRVK